MTSTVLRAFPLEIFLRILFFCGASTLATCSRLSHEFLALSSEQLWGKNAVVISSSLQLHLLFRSVSKKHQNDYQSLPPFIVQHLNPRRIHTLVLTNSSLLRTSLVLGTSFDPNRTLGPLRPQRMIIQKASSLSSVVDSLFKHVRPKELVFVVPNESITRLFLQPPPHSAHIRSNHIVVVVEHLRGSFRLEGGSELNSLFFGTGSSGLDPLSVARQHPCSLRFVLPPSASTDQARFSAFLEERCRGGGLLPDWFRGREGAVIVEVGNEEAKGWVEAGKALVPFLSRKLVSVVVGEKSWEGWFD